MNSVVASRYLVGSASGVYSWHILVTTETDNIVVLDVTRAPDGRGCYLALADWLKFSPEWHEETVDTLFNPDFGCWAENVNHFTSVERLGYVLPGQTEPWPIVEHDGDLFCHHPDAQYDERYDNYIMLQRSNL